MWDSQYDRKRGNSAQEGYVRAKMSPVKLSSVKGQLDSVNSTHFLDYNRQLVKVAFST